MPSAGFAMAVREYRWLLDRGYPVAATIKLVGDRHRLEREDRLILFRGVASTSVSLVRRSLLIDSVRGRPLLVDGYNQIYAVMHYRDGRPVFLSSDGLLRDAGAAHGRIPDQVRFEVALECLASAIAAAGPARVSAFFDSPVSGSAGHAARFAAVLSTFGVTAEAQVARSADAPLKSVPAGGAVATGDSAVIDALGAAGGDAAVFDAARFAIERAWGPRSWLDLGAVLEKPKDLPAVD